MDPDANLKEQLELARKLADVDALDQGIAVEYGARLAELVLALDGWMRRGGFRPSAWRKV